MNQLCKRCGVQMGLGKAIKQTYSGMSDFIGGEVVTLSAGGPGVLIDCMKCHKCGYSVTGVMDAYEQTDATSRCCDIGAE